MTANIIINYYYVEEDTWTEDDWDDYEELEQDDEEQHVHDYEWTTEWEVTCMDTGLEIGVCSCGESIEKTIEMTDHVMDQGVCTYCGYEDPDYEKEEYITVEYNANGGTGAPSKVRYLIQGEKVEITLSTIEPSRDGYKFVGWHCEESSSSAFNAPGERITWNVYGEYTLVYYAQWEKKASVTFTKMEAYWDTGWADDEFVLDMDFEYEGTSPVVRCEVSCWDKNNKPIEPIDSLINDGSYGGEWACIHSLYEGGGETGSLVRGQTYYWKATVRNAAGEEFESETKSVVFTTEGTRFG